MKLRSILLLLTILVALCAGYWYVLHSEESRRLQVVEAQRFFSFSASDIRGIRVARVGEKAAAAQRAENGVWSMAEPLTGIEPAQVAWNRLADVIADLSCVRPIEESPRNLALYELDPPRLEMTITTASGAESHMMFGAVEPTQTYRYARLDQGAVGLVVDKVFHELNRSLLDLRSRYLFSVGDEGITRIEYARISPRKGSGEPPASTGTPEMANAQESVAVVIELGGDGLWRMTQPVAAMADQERVAKLANDIRFAAGRNYVDEPANLDDYGLNPPAARLTVTAGVGRTPQTAYFGAMDKSEKNGVFVKRAGAPSVFVADATLCTIYIESPDALRESRLMTHKASDLQAFQYRASTTDVTLANDPEKGWLFAADGSPTDQVAVSAFISKLLNIKGKEFPTEPATAPQFGFDAPAVRIELTFGNNIPPATICLGLETPDGKRRYAMQDNAVVTALDKADADALIATAFTFSPKTLFELPKGPTPNIAVTLDGNDYVFTFKSGAWLIEKPAGKVWESQTDMLALLKGINPITAVRLESETTPTDLAQYGLDAPVLVVWTLGENASGPIKIGKPCADNSQQRYAIPAGRPGVFRVTQSVADSVRDACRGVRDR